MNNTTIQVTEKNPMKNVTLSKVVVNITVGKSGEPLDKASRILNELTGHKSYQRKAKQTIKTFGIRKGEPIACMVTLRKKDAETFLNRALEAIGRKLKNSSFDKEGNVSFGLKEHIEIPGAKYDPELGIIGMNINISLERLGYRIKKRRRCRSTISSSHKVTDQDAMKFMKEQFAVEVGG